MPQSEILRYHSCEEYEVRINECRDVLENLTLEGLYKDKSIVGDTLNPGYVPKVISPGATLGRISGSKFLQNTIKDILSK